MKNLKFISCCALISVASISTQAQFLPANAAAPTAISYGGPVKAEESNASAPALTAKTNHGGGYGFSLVSDVNQDKTHAFSIIHRDFFGSGQPHSPFGVYGDGQTIISSKDNDPFMIQDPTVSGGPVNFRVMRTGHTIIADNIYGVQFNAKLQVEETNGNNKALLVKTTHGTGYGFCMVADVNKDKTHAFSIYHRDFFGTNSTHSPFGVYGDGQTIISSKAGAASPNELSQPNEAVFIVQDPTSSGGPLNFRVFKTGKTIIGPKTTWNVHNDAMLSVDGKVTCRELVVLNNTWWADYVFDPKYKLEPLQNVEEYINAHKHLKGFKTAQKYASDGIEVGEILRLQQEKIEELTLYLIQQQKKIEELGLKKADK